MGEDTGGGISLRWRGYLGMVHGDAVSAQYRQGVSPSTKT